MKFLKICFMVIATLFTISTVSIKAWSEEVGVKIDNVNTSEDTTISIKKGDAKSNKKKWTISEGTDTVTGDKDAMMKNAEKNWKKACTEWKTELKDMNKKNEILMINCGKMTCTKDGVESVCSSEGTYKLKVLLEE